MRTNSGSPGLVLVLLGCLIAVSAAAASSGANSLAVTYVGNEGFLIEADGTKILVDALYREGVQGYIVHPPDRRDAMEGARPPFDDIDLVLATHDHADHFDAAAVAACLRHNPGATFVSTPMAVERLQDEMDKDATMRSRIVGVHPVEGERFSRTVNGIELQVINLHHGRTRSVQNLGFLARFAGWTILHIGDTEATIDDLLLYDLAADDIDIAFIPYWFLIDDTRDDELLRAIPSERIAVMHVPPRDSRAQHIEDRGGWDAMLDRIEEQYRGAVTFREPMQTRNFSRSPE